MSVCDDEEVGAGAEEENEERQEEGIPWSCVDEGIRQELVKLLNPWPHVNGWIALAGSLEMSFGSIDVAFIESLNGVQAKSFFDEYDKRCDASYNDICQGLRKLKRVDCLRILDKHHDRILQNFKMMKERISHASNSTATGRCVSLPRFNSSMTYNSIPQHMCSQNSAPQHLCRFNSIPQHMCSQNSAPQHLCRCVPSIICSQNGPRQPTCLSLPASTCFNHGLSCSHLVHSLPTQMQSGCVAGGSRHSSTHNCCHIHSQLPTAFIPPHPWMDSHQTITKLPLYLHQPSYTPPASHSLNTTDVSLCGFPMPAGSSNAQWNSMSQDMSSSSSYLTQAQEFPQGAVASPTDIKFKKSTRISKKSTPYQPSNEQQASNAEQKGQLTSMPEELSRVGMLSRRNSPPELKKSPPCASYSTATCFKVFITYSREGKIHDTEMKKLMLLLSNNLQFKVYIDEPTSDRTRVEGSHVEMHQSGFTAADFILVCISPKYLEDISKTSPSSDKSSRSIHTLHIYQMMEQEHRRRNQQVASGNLVKKSRFVSLMFGNLSPDQMPDWLHKHYPAFKWPSDDENVVKYLQKSREVRSSSTQTMGEVYI